MVEVRAFQLAHVLKIVVEVRAFQLANVLKIVVEVRAFQLAHVLKVRLRVSKGMLPNKYFHSNKYCILYYFNLCKP